MVGKKRGGGSAVSFQYKGPEAGCFWISGVAGGLAF